MVDLRVVREGAIASEIAIALAAQKGAANGVAPLDAASKVPAANSRVASVAGRQGAVTLGVADVAGAVALVDKGVAGGVAPLDASNLVPEIHIPSVAITDAFEVASEAAMLALTAQRGDVAIRSDINRSFVLRLTPASTLDNWAELRTPTDAVLSVNGRTGAVNLSDLFAAVNDARLRTIRDEGLSLTNRAILDFLGSGVIVEDDSVTGRTKVTISGAAAGAASETAAGITEQATQEEVGAGTAGNLFATVARLKAELDRRGPMDASVELLRNSADGGVQGIATGGFAAIIWAFEVADGRNWHSISTNQDRITPDAPGYYAGMVYTAWDANSVVGRREVLVRKWSGTVNIIIARDIISTGSGGQFNSASPMSVPFSSYVAQGEYFTVDVFQNTGASLNLDNTSRFNLARVR